ncbi:cytochrome b/b6 domain-containing protein, partial [Acinetobacter baumannii]
MNFHISVGITILVLTALRLFWRVTHPVAPESALPAWQRVSSEVVHWLLYALVLAATLSGWLFA